MLDQLPSTAIDRVALDAAQVEVTPEGYLRVLAPIARTGVQTYTLSDGRTFNVLRHPDDVFDGESLASWAGKPITLDHPDSPVSSKDYTEHSRGQTGTEVIADQRPPAVQEQRHGYVRVLLMVNDADAVKAARTTHQELSCGYTLDWTAEQGVWGGVPYQLRQRNIRGNHVALVQKGRAGPDVRVPHGLDSAAVALDVMPAQFIPDEEDPPVADNKQTSERVTLTRDGEAVELPPGAHQVVKGWLGDADGKAQTLADKLKDMEEKFNAMKGERDAALAELGKFKKGAKDADDREATFAQRVQDAATEYIKTLRDAERVTLGTDVTFDDCATPADIRLKVVQTRYPDVEIAPLAADASDSDRAVHAAQVAGMFRIAVGQVSDEKAPADKPKRKVLDQNAKDAAEARDKMIADLEKGEG